MSKQWVQLTIEKRTIIITMDSNGSYRVAFHNPACTPTLEHIRVYAPNENSNGVLVRYLQTGEI